MKKRDVIKKLMKETTKNKFTINKGILRAEKVCFAKPIKLKDRYAIERKLKQNKLNYIFSGMDCVLIR